jgi:hypothetical protein
MAGFLFWVRILVFYGQHRSELSVWSGTVMNTKPRPFRKPKGVEPASANHMKLTSCSGSIQM